VRKAAKSKPIPSAVLQRMALYHCLLTDWLKMGKDDMVTSKELSNALELTDATIRNDLSYLGDGPGIRGMGYNIDDLKLLLERFLLLPSSAQVAFVGSKKTIGSILDFFSAEKFGLLPTAFFSENAKDCGEFINDFKIYPVEAIPSVLNSLGIKVAVIATKPAWVQHSIDLLAKAGVKGVLNLTPTIEARVPDGVKVTQIRIPCDLKTLFYHAGQTEQSQKSLEMVF